MNNSYYTVSSTSPLYYSAYTDESPISTYWDMTIGALCLICFTFGCIGNINALIYFSQVRANLATTIYLIMASTDLVACFTILPVMVCFMNYNRDPAMFAIPWFCDAWGMIWAFIPYFSVFLVFTLSIVRTISLVSPFRNIPDKVVLGIIAGYGLYLVLRIAVPYGMRLGIFRYNLVMVQCIENIVPGTVHFEKYKVYKVVSNTIQLAFPLVPIITSSIVSCVYVWKSSKLVTTKPARSHDRPKASHVFIRKLRRKPEHADQTPKKSTVQKQATTTILIITFVYIFLNIPVFIWYMLYLTDNFILTNKIFFIYDFVNFYGWSFVYVVSVTINAAVNPVVYICRIKKMREYLTEAAKTNINTLVTMTKRMCCRKDQEEREREYEDERVYEEMFRTTMTMSIRGYESVRMS